MPIKEFRLIVTGSRGFKEYDYLCEVLDWALKNKISQNYSITIVSGTAKGADTMGEQYANERGFNIHRMPADWNAYGKRAGYVRNNDMALYAVNAEGGCVVFWDGISRGTKHMINLSLKHNFKCIIVEYPIKKAYLVTHAL